MADIEMTEKGKIVIDPGFIFENLSDEQKEELAKRFAWDSVIWNEIKDAVKLEYGRISYNETLLKLRVAFLTEVPSDDESWVTRANPYDRVADTIAALLENMKTQNNKARECDQAYWRIYHWAMEHITFEDRRTIPAGPKHKLYQNMMPEAVQLLNLWMTEEDIPFSKACRQGNHWTNENGSKFTFCPDCGTRIGENK